MSPRDNPAATDDRVLGRWVWQCVRSSWPVLVVVLALVATAALTARSPDRRLPLDPGSTEPGGTRALLAVLTELGRQVQVVDPDGLGDGDVILLLRDQLTERQRRDLRARVADGARVIVTDPSSPLTPEATGSVSPVGRIAPGACAIGALDGVDEIAAGGGARYEVPEGSVGCFTAAEASWLVVTPAGRGEIVAIGGPGFLTNGGLGRADNAVLATQLVTPAGSETVTVTRPVLAGAAEGGDESLATLVPSWVRVLLLQLVVAFIVLVMWRARRLGQPLVDAAPVRLAASELTTAVGAMAARNRLRADTTRRIAADTRRRVARRLGLPADADTDEVASAVAARTGRSAGAAADTLTPRPPADDRAMLEAVGNLTVLEQDTVPAPSTTPEHLDDH